MLKYLKKWRTNLIDIKAVIELDTNQIVGFVFDDWAIADLQTLGYVFEDLIPSQADAIMQVITEIEGETYDN